MRKTLLLITLALCTTTLSLSSCGTVNEDLGSTPYYGPSDIYPYASGWWGLRAFGLTQVGFNIADVRCVNANKTVTIASTVAGDFDVTTLANQCPSDTYYIAKLYDQSGHGVDLTQTVVANQPKLLLNCVGTLPCISFVATSQMSLTGSLPGNIPQPMSLTAVAMTENNSTQTIIGNDPSQFASLGFTSDSNPSPSPNPVPVMSSATNLQGAPVQPNTYHLYSAVFSPGASVLHTDTTSSNSADAGSLGLGPALTVGSAASGGYLQGKVLELGVWPTPFNPGQIAVFSNSANTYWGIN